MAAEQVFMGLPKWAQGVIAVASLGIVAFIGWKIYSKVKFRMDNAGAFKEKNDVKNELTVLEKKNIKPSFPDSQYSAWANKLSSAMDGYGSDFSPIINVFINMKNNADVLKLMDAYGIREISSGRFNLEPNFKGTLSATITDQLDSKEVIQINLALAKKAITIKF